MLNNSERPQEETEQNNLNFIKINEGAAHCCLYPRSHTAKHSKKFSLIIQNTFLK